MIPSEGAEKARQWFDRFTGGFFCDDEGINREVRARIRHSLSVAENIRHIFNGLSQKEQFIPFSLLETAALLHDVGRFPDLTGKDGGGGTETKDHASEGVNLLKERNVLNGFSEREKELVYLSIFYHNKKGAHLQCGDKEVIAISELLRQADKMDILGSR